ncbi:hypothetical protein AB0G64_34780 [Streptomyces longwoodensis]|uniref:hypothetical protein n=1 Tax=Streptomyces longwoodensis TaxID=68231 RepID=UPI0033E3AB44
MSGDMGGGRPDRKDGPKRLPRARPRLLARARVGWPPALRELKDLLYEVYVEADAPSLDEICKDIAADVHEDLPGGPSRDTISRVISGSGGPQQQADVVAVAKVLARRAAWDADDLARRVRELWVRARMAHGAGRPIGDLRADVRLVLDRGLGIHPALDAKDARDRFGILPAYVLRDHDACLKRVVDAAVAGDSGIAVLVGGSSTGKTRALWEAVRELPDGWRLWHPLTPTAPEAVLAALPDIAPKTVVWLNEAQHYLAPDPLGEQVAAALRKLLTDPSRAPVLILGTLWLEHWNALTTGNRHPGARALLDGHKIDVPKAFTPADLAALDATADADPRLTKAAQRADDAQVTQYLAGVPYLMDRYHAAEGATRALIHAAMDARRLGAGLHIPLVWLTAAAPGYLTDTEYRALEADWLPEALAYVTTPCNGIPGILTPVNTSGPRNQRNSRRPVAPSPQGPHYLLADYLDQHGRRHRAATIPPIDFWTAAADHAHPTDLTKLGNAAWKRGLYRDAAQLLKKSTSYGNLQAARDLVNHLHTLHPTDTRPARWVVTGAALDNPADVAWLLRELRRVGAQEQATALAGRVAAGSPLDNPFAVAKLLWELRRVGAQEQATALAGRVAAGSPLDNPIAVVKLLRELRRVGAQEQITALAGRAVADASLDDASDVAWLVRELHAAGAQEQITTLAGRAVMNVPLGNPDDVAELLEELRKAGAQERFTALAGRAVVNVPLDDPVVVSWLLRELVEAGAQEQFTALAGRAVVNVPLGNPVAVARLLEELRKVGAQEQATALARRAAANADLDDVGMVAWLVRELHAVGAQEEATALARRAVAHAPLDDPSDVAWLMRELRELRKVGAQEQATALARRAVAHAPLDNAVAVAELLEELRKVGAQEQMTALAGRAAAHAPLDNPVAVAELVRVLRKVGAQEQATALAGRAVAHAPPRQPVRCRLAGAGAAQGRGAGAGHCPGRAGRCGRPPRRRVRCRLAGAGAAQGGGAGAGHCPGRAGRRARPPRQSGQHRRAAAGNAGGGGARALHCPGQAGR